MSDTKRVRRSELERYMLDYPDDPLAEPLRAALAVVDAATVKDWCLLCQLGPVTEGLPEQVGGCPVAAFDALVEDDRLDGEGE